MFFIGYKARLLGFAQLKPKDKVVPKRYQFIKINKTQLDLNEQCFLTTNKLD